MKMNEKKKQELKKKLANVPNPPVPNRAHTEMSTKNDCKSSNNKDCNNAKQRKD
jgi:hypothetical protein